MSRAKPTQLKRLHGSYRPDRAPRNEAQPEGGRPVCPAWLTPDAKACWRRLARPLHAAGLLTRIDQNALARYCTLHTRWLEAERHLVEHGSVHKLPSGYVAQSPFVSIAAKLAVLLANIESSFGMSPQARTRISIEPEPAKELDPLTEIIQRGNGGPVGKIESSA